MGVNRPGSVPVLVLMLLAPALGAAQTASQRLERLGAESYERGLDLYPVSEIFRRGAAARPLSGQENLQRGRRPAAGQGRARLHRRAPRAAARALSLDSERARRDPDRRTERKRENHARAARLACARFARVAGLLGTPALGILAARRRCGLRPGASRRPAAFPQRGRLSCLVPAPAALSGVPGERGGGDARRDRKSVVEG